MPRGYNAILQVNADYFEIIDTEEKAYWLGFIFADGYVAQKKPWVVIIQIKDIEHLQKFADTIGYTGKIKMKRGGNAGGFGRPDSIMGRLEICRKKMCEDLNRWGRNTKPMRVPNIPKHLIPHFIRGYFDGDGSITTSRITKDLDSGRKVYQYLMANVIGEVQFMKDIQAILAEQGISSLLKETPNHSEGMIYLNVWGGNNMRKLHQFLYSGATVSLERKAIKWQALYRPYGEKSLLANPEYAGKPLEPLLEVNIGNDV